jgi:predicted small lipoprotein YifL
VTPARKKPITFMLAAAALAISLVSCGRRGPLEPPPGASASAAPGGAPVNASTPPGGAAAAPGAQPATAPATRVPKKPFFLDPLL